MKRIITTSVLIVFLILVLSSCGKPPEGIEETNVIYLVQDQLQKLNKIRDDKERQKKYFKELMESFDVLFVFKKDTSIVVSSTEFKPKYDSIGHTIGDNKFITTKDVYYTSDKDGSYFSLNNLAWYSTKSDMKKDIEGIKNNYFFDTKIVGDAIYIDYEMGLSLGSSPRKVEIEGKPVVKLKKGMVFADTDPEKINTDLKEKILLVPKGTILSGNASVSGNIVKSNVKKGIVTLTSLRDIYIYFRNMNLSLSFDRKKWDVSIFSFEIIPKFEVSALSDNEIFFNIQTSAVYDKAKKSFSIAKLLLKSL